MTTKTIILRILSTLAIVGITHGFHIPTPTTIAVPHRHRSSSTILRLAKRNNNNRNSSNDVVSVEATTPSSQSQLSRRQVGELSFAAAGLLTSFLGTRENTPQEYGLWGVLPVGPYKRKKTIMETIVPDTIWTFDQKVCECM
jgi:hypothetical protein